MANPLDSVPIHLDKDGTVPLYSQIVTALARAIDSGQLPPDTRLPSIRALAKQLEVNSVTVVTAYKELEQQGYVWSRMGSGTFVRSPSPPKTVRQVHIPAQGINFASVTPTPEFFPVEDFQRLLNLVLDRDGGSAFTYQESQGWPPLRESMNQYLQDCGIETSEDSIHVISGAQQGIDLAAKILVNPGDTIFVEGPTYHGAIASFQSRGARIVPVPLQKDGPDMDSLGALLNRHKPRLFYAMPNFQNPTGYSYSRRKKQMLLGLAQEHQFIIIEDDYLSELSFTGRCHPPLKAMDIQDRVLYIKSFSKILMPGLRLGLLVAPAPLNDRVGSAKQYSDISSSGLFQRTLDLYLREQAWQQHLDNMKEKYGSRYNTAIQAIREHLPQVEFTPPQGGFHIWIKLPTGISGVELHRRCLQENVIIIPGSIFTPHGHYGQWIRLSFAACAEDQIRTGISTIGRLLKEQDQPNIQPLL